MTQLSVNTDNIALKSDGTITRGSIGWETNVVAWAMKGWNRQVIDITGRTMQGEVFVPLAMNTQWMEPPAAYFGTVALSTRAPHPMIRVFDLFTTKPLTDKFITDELLHLTDPYIFGIGFTNLPTPDSEDADGEFEQLILGRARTYVPDSSIDDPGTGFCRLVDDTRVGSGAAVAQHKIYYTRAYYTTFDTTDVKQFLDLPSQRALLSGSFVKPSNDLETFQQIAQNKGVGGW